MKTWKLVSGILSMILFVIVTFQSCAAGVANSLEANGETSGSAGGTPDRTEAGEAAEAR